jgi:hypothetical protein
MRLSQEIKNISLALCEAQKEIKNVNQTAENPFFKSNYAPLDEILSYLRPIYNKHGITIIQDISSTDNTITISTMLLHTTGEWIQQDGLIIPLEKHTAQSAGSAVTYGRRYTLNAIAGLASKDEDDDANATKPKDKQPDKKPTPKKEESLIKTKEQYTAFYNSLNEDIKFLCKDMTDKERYDLFITHKWIIAEIDKALTLKAQE